jgi:hypothetical protein
MHICEKVLVHYFCWLNFDEPAKVMHICEKVLVHYFCWLNFDEPAKVMHICEKVLVHYFCWLNFDEPAKVMHICEKVLVHYFCWLNFDEPAKVMHICEKVLVHYFCWLNFDEPAKVMHICEKVLVHYFCWLNFDEPAKVMHICEKVLVHYFCWLNFHEPAKVMHTCKKSLMHYFCWLNFDEPAKVMHICEKVLVHYFCWLNFHEPAKVMHICEKVLVHYFCWLNFHEPAKVMHTCKKSLMHYFCWLNFDEPAKVMHICEKVLVHYFCWLNFHEPAKVMHICEKVLVHYFCWLNFDEPAKAGFRSKKSTINNIVRLERYARDNLIRSRHSAVIFFDIKAAFDSVWHDGLLYKINDFNLPPYLSSYLMSFLHNRTANIEFENALSRSFNLKSGTPQGSPLSPILYILYTADSMNGIPDHTEHGLFADDTALWTSSNTTSNLSSRLQQSVVAFEKWCRCWKLKLQPTKTELIHFNVHPRRKYKFEVTVKVEDTMITPKDSTRYLGVIIDKELKWNKHLQHIEKCVAPRISLLRYLSNTAQAPNEKIMINIFKSIVRTVMIYGHQVLLTAGDNIWERLQIIQNKAIRASLNLPHYISTTYIHQLTNIPKIKDYAKSLLQQSINTAINNNDVILRNNLEEIQCQV